MSETAIGIAVRNEPAVETGDGGAGRDRLSLVKLFVPLAAVATMVLIIRLYLIRFGFSTGLDATSPQFGRHWYPWLAFNLFVVGGSIAAWCIWLARTRCKTCVRQFNLTGAIEARHERLHLWSFTCLLAVIMVWWFTMTVSTELDAAWHQSTLRDTSLTPNHIFIFYLQAPVMLGLAIASAVYGRTRLPAVWGPKKGTAAAYVVGAGAVFVLLMLQAVNEFGHSLWVFEERFSDPLHWPLAIGGLGTLAFIPMLIQALDRSVDLSEPVDGDAP
jgi:methane/ammonia monooxygenase subunit C